MKRLKIDILSFLIKPWFFLVIISLFLNFTPSSLQSIVNEENKTVTISATRVRVAVVSMVGKSTAVRYSAVLRASDRALLAFTDSGRLISRPAKLGALVKAGQVLARLDDKPYKNAVKAAKASLMEAKTRLRQLELDELRVKRLQQADAATTEELEDVSLGLEASRARCDAALTAHREARRRLQEAVLRAPYSGLVTETFIEPGEVAAAGSPIVALSNHDCFEVEIEVPESVLATLTPDCHLLVDLPNWKLYGLKATITSMGRGTFRPGGLFPVIVTLEKNPTLMPGLSAEVILPTAAVHGLTVPLSAVINSSGHKAHLFIVKDGRARLVPILTGSLQGSKVEVDGELAVGDQVIVAGHSNLLDGDPVEVAQ